MLMTPSIAHSYTEVCDNYVSSFAQMNQFQKDGTLEQSKTCQSRARSKHGWQAGPTMLVIMGLEKK